MEGLVQRCPFIILSGGENTRLDVLRGTIYKPFLELRRTTLVARHVTRAVRAGHRMIRIVIDNDDPIVAGYVAELADAVDVDVDLLAIPGDARTKITNVLDLCESPSPAMVVLGDTYAWYDSRQLLSRLDPGIACCIAVAPYRLQFGVVDVVDDLVTGFNEKPMTGYLVNLGIMAFGADAIDAMKRGTGVGELLAELAALGRLASVELSEGFLTVDSLDGVAHALSARGRRLLDG